MGSKEEARIFVGGLSWETTDRDLEDAFSRFGKVVEAQVMLDRDTGRPRGFGFVTFADQRAVDSSINEMHGQELGGRVISVNKAEPKLGSDGSDRYHGGGGGYSSGGRGGYRGGGLDRPPAGSSDCFKCGRPGHWARDCPSSGGGGGDRFSSRPRLGGGGGGGTRDRFGAYDRYDDRYVDDRYDGGRYGDRDHVDSKYDRYGGGRDRYNSERYPPSGDRIAGDRYGASDYPLDSYSKDRSYGRDSGPIRGGGDRYGGAPGRYEGGGSGGGYRERPGPYDRPSKGGLRHMNVPPGVAVHRLMMIVTDGGASCCFLELRLDPTDGASVAVLFSLP